MSTSNGAPRRVGVIPFDRDLVADYLDRSAITYQRDSDGDIVIQFAPHDVHNYQLTTLLMAQGVNGEIFGARSMSNVRIAEDFLTAAIALCNNWNMNNVMPTAFVVGEASEEVIQGEIVLQNHWPLSAGVTQPIIDEFASNFLGASHAFWEWFATEGVAAMNARSDADADGQDPALEAEIRTDT